MEQATIAQLNRQSSPITTSVRYCLYARKSTEIDELQALSIDSQIKEMLQIAERDKLDVVEIKKERHSAKVSGFSRTNICMTKMPLGSPDLGTFLR